MDGTLLLYLTNCNQREAVPRCQEFEPEIYTSVYIFEQRPLLMISQSGLRRSDDRHLPPKSSSSARRGACGESV